MRKTDNPAHSHSLALSLCLIQPSPTRRTLSPRDALPRPRACSRFPTFILPPTVMPWSFGAFARACAQSFQHWRCYACPKRRFGHILPACERVSWERSELEVEQVFQVLCKYKYIGSMSEDAGRALSRIVRVRVYQEQEPVYVQGEAFDAHDGFFFMVLFGEVDIHEVRSSPCPNLEPRCWHP